MPTPSDIWGHDPNRDFYSTVFYGQDMGSRDIKDALDAIVHPDLRKALGFLEEQMSRGAARASYSDKRADSFLCSGEYVFSGFHGMMGKALERAYPVYQLQPSGLGEIILLRKWD